MNRTHHKHGALAILVLALLLGLLLAAGPASATTVNTAHGYFTSVLYQQAVPDVGDDGTLYFTDWVCYVTFDQVTGPDGSRFLGYGVACIDVVIPPKGDNYHTGEAVFVGTDPAGIVYDPSKSLSENLAPYGLLWTGTWDGYTLNKRNHKAVLVLDGVGSNADYTAYAEMKSGQFEVDPETGLVNFSTSWTMRALVSPK